MDKYIGLGFMVVVAGAVASLWVWQLGFALVVVGFVSPVLVRPFLLAWRGAALRVAALRLTSPPPTPAESSAIAARELEHIVSEELSFPQGILILAEQIEAILSEQKALAKKADMPVAPLEGLERDLSRYLSPRLSARAGSEATEKGRSPN